jgi:DamX protein
MKDTDYDNRDAPTYLAHYGMHRPPFATKTEDDMYYNEPTRTKRLDILLHLTQYGNELLLVTGPEGSGKSTLMQQFLKQAPGSWKICSLNAHAKLDEEQLLYRICHSFNLPVETGTLGAITTSIKRQLDQLLASTKTVVIVIDNAHILSNDCLVLLTDLAKIKNPHSGALLRIILFAEPQIKIQFASIELENKPKYPIRKIDLPPFDEINTGELIRHRTRTAGLEADSTFTEAAIGKIYKQSEGLPGNIVELAHRVLFEMTPLKRRTKPRPMAESNEEKAKRPIGLISAITVVVLIALILMFQKEINQLYSQKKPPTAERTPERTVTALAIPQLADEALNTEANALNGGDKHTQSAATDKATFADTSSEPTVQTTVPSTAINEEENTAASKLSAPNHTNVPSGLVRNIHQEQWLLEQTPNDYTLQLVAGYQKTTVNNYLKRHKLPTTELAYYHSLNKGKAWHSLVYGIYPDYNSAKLAITDLPPAVRQSKPWIRRLKNIQNEINEAADAATGN